MTQQLRSLWVAPPACFPPRLDTPASGLAASLCHCLRLALSEPGVHEMIHVPPAPNSTAPRAAQGQLPAGRATRREAAAPWQVLITEHPRPLAMLQSGLFFR